jgi:predicted nucleic acid-binding Zn ribbon protein
MVTRRKDSSSRKPVWQDSSETTLYARKRWSLRKRRELSDHNEFDPRPVTDDDWTVATEDDEPSLSRISPPEALGSVLGDLVSQKGWASRLESAKIFGQWHAICGEDLAAHCEPVRLAGGILVLRVESQIWATQLRYCIPDIRANIEAHLGIANIRDVRIVIGPLEDESR